MTIQQLVAVLWAQWRSFVNRRTRTKGFGVLLAVALAFLWYAGWTFAGMTLAKFASDPGSVPALKLVLIPGLLVGFVYWQIVPVVMATAGLSLDMSRILVYPVPHGHLFAAEVFLRMTTAIETLIMTVGLFAGLLLNPAIPGWAPFALLPYIAANVFLSAGLRDLLSRLWERKGVRELLVLLLVLISALPQMLLAAGLPPRYKALVLSGFGPFWPWSAAGTLALGTVSYVAMLASLFWMGLAYAFGRRQYELTLRFDAAEARGLRVPRSRRTIGESLARSIGSLFRDPLGALVEKEILILSRSARFRLLFLMGFSFGLLIWLPLTLRADQHSAFQTHYLTVVSAYALMLLGEVLFWNNFGMDRSAAQTYFVTPVALSSVIMAKNLAAAVFVALEVAMVTVCCKLLRLSLPREQVLEAFTVTAVLTTFLVSVGNLVSTYYPRPIDPARSWRTSSTGRAGIYLLLLYPVVTAPALLAYAARYAFKSDLAFYGVLAIDFLFGAVVYAVALESAVNNALRRKEQMILALGRNEGPVAA